MSTTLSYGYKLPDGGDRGSSWFLDLESNITRVNGHTHDGINSPPLPASSITKGTSSIVNGSWSLVADGTYKQSITLPAGFTVDTAIMKFQVDSGGEDGDDFYPTIVKTGVNTYDIYINDNSIDVLATYV